MKTVYPPAQEAVAIESAPISASIQSPLDTPQYDKNYSKDHDVSIMGVFAFVTPIMFIIFCGRNESIFHDNNLFIEILLSGALIIRLFSAIYVSKVAAEQNRSARNWMALAFFAPGTALMIIGQMKRFMAPPVARKQVYHDMHDTAPLLQ